MYSLALHFTSSHYNMYLHNTMTIHCLLSVADESVALIFINMTL